MVGEEGPDVGHEQVGHLERQLIVITRSGRARLRTLERLVDQVQDQLLALLSAAERAELVRLLLLIGPGSVDLG